MCFVFIPAQHFLPRRVFKEWFLKSGCFDNIAQRNYINPAILWLCVDGGILKYFAGIFFYIYFAVL
jgi:hypothetical protein